MELFRLLVFFNFIVIALPSGILPELHSLRHMFKKKFDAKLDKHPKEIQLSHFTMLEALGAGTFGKVNLARMGDKFFAHKYIELKDVKDEGYQLSHEVAQRELKIHLALSDHDIKPFVPHVVTLEHFHIEKNHEHKPTKIHFFMELCYGTLNDLVTFYAHHNLKMSTEALNHWLHQMIDAIEQVHNIGVAHHDVKANQFLIRPDGTLALADFGCATALADPTSHHTGDGIFNYEKDWLQLAGRLIESWQQRKINDGTPLIADNVAHLNDLKNKLAERKLAVYPKYKAIKKAWHAARNKSKKKKVKPADFKTEEVKKELDGYNVRHHAFFTDYEKHHHKNPYSAHVEVKSDGLHYTVHDSTFKTPKNEVSGVLAMPKAPGFGEYGTLAGSHAGGSSGHHGGAHHGIAEHHDAGGPSVHKKHRKR